jgi:hypothetical protein
MYRNDSQKPAIAIASSNNDQLGGHTSPRQSLARRLAYRLCCLCFWLVLMALVQPILAQSDLPNSPMPDFDDCEPGLFQIERSSDHVFEIGINRVSSEPVRQIWIVATLSEPAPKNFTFRAELEADQHWGDGVESSCWVQDTKVVILVYVSEGFYPTLGNVLTLHGEDSVSGDPIVVRLLALDGIVMTDNLPIRTRSKDPIWILDMSGARVGSYDPLQENGLATALAKLPNGLYVRVDAYGRPVGDGKIVKQGHE